MLRAQFFATSACPDHRQCTEWLRPNPARVLVQCLEKTNILSGISRNDHTGFTRYRLSDAGKDGDIRTGARLTMAEACASRTHRRQANLPPAGFEDREDHRTPCASVPTLQYPHYAAKSSAPGTLPRSSATVRGQLHPECERGY